MNGLLGMHTSPFFRRPSWQLSLALFPFLIAAILALVAPFYTFLQTDDFCTFARVIHREHGNPFADAAYMYQNWSGRYSAMFTVSLVATISLFVPVGLAYSLSLACFLILFALACLAISPLIDTNRRVSVPFAAILFASTLIAMPSKLEQYLWLTGAAVYFIGTSLLFVLILVMSAPRADRTRAIPREVLIGALIALITGFNEFLAIVTGACVLWFGFRDIRAEKKNWHQAILRLTIFAAAFATTILAPGNFARDSTSVTARHEIGNATALAIKSLWQFAHGMSEQQTLPIFAALVGSAAVGAMVARGRSKIRDWAPVALILLCSLPMHLWVYSFLTGEAAPGRVLNQAFMHVTAAGCLVAAAIGSRLSALSEHNPTSWAAALLGLAGIFLIASPSFRSFARVAHEFAPRWHAQQLERHRGFGSLPRPISQPAYVRPYSLGDSSPPVFAGADVTSSPENWINRCVADYYEANSVILMRRTQY
ncbi:hypothetical protein J5837_01785 [Pseudoxanthomonas helianthi]|uniref:Transmembrane protein n=1 Tax=Pseudoxanthomonas helianthi TaxID=1453541 RepID=A0A940X0X5_9GAMM|nr:DUF6056 family protein [Pseudoxanthomonas helianthi]MBP3983141.1 hypothetical protein [Pseudoxanthomonas helianthi]